MQLQSDRSHRLDEIKTQFRAREGYYRLMNSPDYSQRSQRAMGFSTGTTNSNSSIASNEKTCIKISLVTLNDNSDTMTGLRQPTIANHRSVNNDSQNQNPGARYHRTSKGTRDKKICFNVGRELFVYNYDGVRTGPDASNPIYKRSYKGSSPTCHDFNQSTASQYSIPLLVGFSQGQVQLIELNGCDDQEGCKEFNTDRLIDKTRVTCVKWLPNSPSLFLVAHASGQLYLYKDDLPCGPSAPTYQLYQQSEGVTVYTCKTKTIRNPIYRWDISMQSDDSINSNGIGSSSSLNKTDSESYSLNEFAFSPCAKYLACVSQDGFLRVYCYDTMELVGRARSYYGGLTCVCWSPDGKYVVTGGEDDLITVWSFVERRVVARGMGHKSWVSVVAFDSFYTGYDLKNTDADNDDDEDEDEDDKEVDERDLAGEGDEDDEDDIRSFDEIRIARQSRAGRFARAGSELRSPTFRHNVKNFSDSPVPSQTMDGFNASSAAPKSYRFGSVGQDTQLCLWDLNDDLLCQPFAKPRVSLISGATSANNLAGPASQNHTSVNESLHNAVDRLSEESLQAETSETLGHSDPIQSYPNNSKDSTNSVGFFSHKASGFTKSFSLIGKRDKRNLSQRGSDKQTSSKTSSSPFKSDSNRLIHDPTKLLGSPLCPRMNEVPLIEPTVCKKISFERLTSLIFCKGGFITSCQDGFVFSWARPSRVSLNLHHRSAHPNNSANNTASPKIHREL